MTYVLKDLEPKWVFRYFEEISSIPRGSGNERAISDYIVEFARKLGLWVKQDEAYNVYIRKPASVGYEIAPTVILQGHLDMVCEKTRDTSHDFEKEGLKLQIIEDRISAIGTTLGADNGIAIAYQMAILADSTLKHPALEILMTTDEERGMTGASCIHSEYLKGSRLINLDTDIEGTFLVSCAGGVKAHIDLPIMYEENPSFKNNYHIQINGLMGGHSGADIHLERANAHVVMGRVLKHLRKKMAFYLCEVKGGTKDNVITRECDCIIALEDQSTDLLEKCIQEISIDLKNEYRIQDPNLTVSLTKLTQKYSLLSKKLTEDFIDLMLIIPQGIISFDQTMKGLVETSLNLGIVNSQRDYLRFGIAIRSSIASKKQALVDKLEVLAKRFNATFTLQGDYPAWQYCEKSQLREIATCVYEKMYGETPKIQSIHAGLECGLIAEKFPHLDMIALGPNVYDIHSPEESVSISSMARVYVYLLTLLENLNTY